MKKLKKVSVLLLGILFLASFSGCENFSGENDEDATEEDSTDEDTLTVSEKIYETLTDAMNKSILSVYLVMETPVNIPGINYFDLPGSLFVDSDSSGTAIVTGSYQIVINTTTQYLFDLNIDLNDYNFLGTVEGTAEMTADMETTVSDFEYTINYKGSGTYLETGISNISWDITFIQDPNNSGTVTGFIEINGITYDVSEIITVGVL